MEGQKLSGDEPKIKALGKYMISAATGKILVPKRH